MRYLTFLLSDQLCGVELSRVREILGYLNFTPTGTEHPAMVGWLNLRGRPVRVLDLRLRFGLPVTRTDDTQMIVVEWNGETLAMIVDNVAALEKPAAITPIGANHRSRIDQRFIVGIANVNDRSVVLLDMGQTTTTTHALPRAA